MNIYLFAHQDDEFFCLPYIRNDILSNVTVNIVYLTNGCFNGVTSAVRNIESLKTFSEIGVGSDNVYFLGEKLQIDDGQLYNNVDIVISSLNCLFKDEDIGKVIFPCFEGGHQDHDSISYVIGYMDMFKTTQKLQFPLYNAYKMPKPLFSVFKIIKEQEISCEEFIFNFLDLRHIFNYTSQKKSFLGLGPFILLRFLFNRKVKLVKFNYSYIQRRPHNGELLYERRTKLKFDYIDMKIKKKLENNK
jgi:N-acetylglucosamine malate deacetylase 1